MEYTFILHQSPYDKLSEKEQRECAFRNAQLQLNGTEIDQLAIRIQFPRQSADFEIHLHIFEPLGGRKYSFEPRLVLAGDSEVTFQPNDDGFFTQQLDCQQMKADRIAICLVGIESLSIHVSVNVNEPQEPPFFQ